MNRKINFISPIRFDGYYLFYVSDFVDSIRTRTNADAIALNENLMILC